ncbi:hypothetical protein [Thiorhodococcus fuscus]|uniref:CheW-like domain-containing protein n=1 Tax=Thiorhodococcus fuscus TaxID=527200 RepID=A0ABW4Y6Z2_9GAMM
MSPSDTPHPPIWPSADYDRQVGRLKAAIGQTIHLVEIEISATHLHIRQLGQPYILLDVLAFPRPDPSRGLTPHLILLDDGRGLNLGRIARISLESNFNPAPSQILYQDREALEGLIYRDRRLTPAFIAERAHRIMGQVLGKDPEAITISGPANQGQIETRETRDQANDA